MLILRSLEKFNPFVVSNRLQSKQNHRTMSPIKNKIMMRPFDTPGVLRILGTQGERKYILFTLCQNTFS